MKPDRQIKALLLAIATLLAVIALRPYASPARVRAGSGEAYLIYVEPGVAMLREPGGTGQVLG